MIILFIFLFFVKILSAEKDCGCNQNFKPVCGNNGQTYENLCKLMCEQRLNTALKLDYPGTCCQKAEFCTTFDDPVCDNLGETHKNQCKFDYKQCVVRKQKNFILKIQKNGPCEPHLGKPEFQSCTFFCDEADEPLCDDSGHTHQNLCKFDLAKCRRLSRGLEAPEIIHIGACKDSDQKTNVPEVPKAKIAPRMINGPSDTHKIWHYGAFPTPANQFTAEMNPYDFEPFPSPEDPTRTTKQTTLKPWQSSPLPPIPSSEATYGTVPPMPPSTVETIDPDFSRTTIVPSLFDSCLSCDSEIDQVPICDNFNQTHKSICKFARWNCERKMSGLQERVLVHIGICNAQSPTFTMEEEICPSKCSKNFKPVCDTNGMTYPNLCTFQMFNCQQRKLGNIHVAWLLYLQECASSPSSKFSETQTTTLPSTTTIPTVNETFDCPKPDCPSSSNVICDSQGVFHQNECQFTYARCLAAKQGITLRIMSEEFCASHPNCDTLKISNCTSEYDPICATDFLTYPNHCHFQVSKCKDSSLDILFKGECKICLNTPCPIIDAADLHVDDSLFICDQNGETKSLCEFKMLRCIYEIKFGYNITEAYNGRCCPRDELCPIDNKPVCDSRGQLHRNMCYFSVAKCRAEKIEHESLSEAPCPEVLSNHDECSKTVCSNEYDPVCGTDGKTYSNLCHFTQKNCNNGNSMMIDIAYRGSCCEEKCSKVDFSPVCDNYNVTHLNLCEFGSQRCIASRTGKNLDMKILEYEACKDIDCKLNCPAIYEPVCAVNGETFSNECELARTVCILNNAGRTSLSLDYEGPCCSNIQCELEFKPVCDSDGRTHINECVFKQEACLSERKNGLNITIDHQGECCNQVCETSDDNQHKVCDNYGTTHNSVCEFLIKKCEAERTGKVLNLSYMDECCQLPPLNCGNNTIICDSDGQTHQNVCEFDYKKCITERTQPKSIAIIHSGECCHLEKCNEKNNPVCDSRGITHQSFCHFRNSKCVYDKVNKNGSNLMLAYDGECCKLDCNNVSEPVCDQNGEIYKNKCYFEHAKCETSKRARDEEMLILTPCNKVRTKN